MMLERRAGGVRRSSSHPVIGSREPRSISALPPCWCPTQPAPRRAHRTIPSTTVSSRPARPRTSRLPPAASHRGHQTALSHESPQALLTSPPAGLAQPQRRTTCWPSTIGARRHAIPTQAETPKGRTWSCSRQTLRRSSPTPPPYTKRSARSRPSSQARRNDHLHAPAHSAGCCGLGNRGVQKWTEEVRQEFGWTSPPACGWPGCSPALGSTGGSAIVAFSNGTYGTRVIERTLRTSAGRDLAALKWVG